MRGSRSTSGGNRVIHRLVHLVAIWVLLGFVAPSVDAREKIDELVLSNGDRIVCEIRELEQGILKVKPPYTKGYVYIEWIHVEQVSSEQLFEFEVDDGSLLYGTIRSIGDTGRVDIEAEDGVAEYDLVQVVHIAQIEKRLLDRTKGSIRAGLTTMRANSQMDLNIGANFTYRHPGYSVSGELSTLVSRRDDTDEVTHNNFNARVNRYIKRKVFYQGHLGLAQNSELDLDLRATLGGGVGRYLKESSKSRLSVLGGLIGNREDYRTELESTINLEAVFQLDYRLYLFTGKKTKMSILLTVLPSLSQSGRVRSTLDTNFDIQLISDFYWNLAVQATADSQPPELSQGYDWLVISSIRYFF
jgi:hypothetical protein